MSAAAPGRGELLASVAHELRSPLNGIKTWAHLLEKQLPDADAGARRAIAGIMTGVDQQVRLIEDLEARHAHGDRLPGDSACIREVLGELVAGATRFAAAGGTIGIDVSPDGATARISVRGNGAAFEVSLPLGAPASRS